MMPNPNLIPRFNIDYDIKDLFSAIKSLKTKPDTSSISSIFTNSHISFTNSGRTSLYVILKALQLPEKSKVGVPLYSCTSVFDAIINAGHIPVFLDIDPDNYTLSPAHLSTKIDDLAVVVVIHTFGRPADIAMIQKIAGDKPVIEDCAHALLSKYNGKLAGTIATVGFFSFRTGKYISAGEGGMIITKNHQLALDIENEIKKLAKPSNVNEIKHIVITYARSVLYQKPWFGLVSLPIGSLIENKVDLTNKCSFETIRMRISDLHIIGKKMQGFKDRVELQRQNSQYLIEQLKNIDLRLPLEAPNTCCNYYLFPIQLKDEFERDKVGEYLKDNDIDAAKLFSKTPNIAKSHYGYGGDCPITEQVAEKILTLPNNYVLRSKELNKIIKLLTKHV